MSHPTIIQGGMGAGISGWRLAKAVSKLGQMGVISGTAIDAILARRLQTGDPGGNLKRALDHFPVPEIARKVYEQYFVAGGKGADQPFQRTSIYSLKPPKALQRLTVVANFVEVFLAKEGHEGKVGINLLEKIQTPNLASLYGAMLAGVDYVLMGAGIPREIPGVLDRYADHEEATLKIDVTGAEEEDDFRMKFDPESVVGKIAGRLKRPDFLAIISSVVLGKALKKRSTGKVDGFIIEGPTAGGHNAPPRGALQLNDDGEPIYGKRDEVDLGKIAKLGLPFWLAGGYGRPEQVREALDQGATGVQVGTPFAFCDESDLDAGLKRDILRKIATDQVDVVTDAKASPTGFPFKVMRLADSLWNPSHYADRTRICDVGYLRTLFKDDDGSVAYRCPSEPVDDYVRKGGCEEDTEGRKCLCNSLVANIGFGQIQSDGREEMPLVTSGDDLSVVRWLLGDGRASYSAADVIRDLCQGLEPAPACLGVRGAPGGW